MKKKAAMKAMKAMKKKSVSKIARGVMSKATVLRGSKEKTVGGLTAKDLIKNKRGKIVSKKASAKGKKSPWIQAVGKARRCTQRRRSSTASKRCTFSNVRTGSGKSRHQLQVWGFPQLWSAGAPGFYQLQ